MMPDVVRRTVAIRLRNVLVATCLVGLFVAACGAPAPPPVVPSEAASRAALDRLIATSISGDLTGLCALGSGTCEQELRNVDPATIPVEPPRVVDTRVVDPVLRGDGIWEQGGRLFALCGRDGMGREYASEVLIFDADGRLLAINAVFWTGARIATNDIAGGTPPPIDCR